MTTALPARCPAPVAPLPARGSRRTGTFSMPITGTFSVPVDKAVRWNSPFYGIEGRGWFLSFHCFAKYVKVTFLNGAALRPVPPVASKHEHVRYFHIHEHDELEEDLLVRWIEQAATLPGEDLF